MSDDIKKGLLGIIVDETEISKVMPEINSLTYRGYAAQDLCARCDFEEVAYLILNKELPNKKQLKEFKKELSKEITLSKNLIDILKKIPKNSHPMDVARTAVSVMGLEDKETKDNSPKANLRKAIRIFAKTPTALAAFYRLRKGKKIIAPKKKFNFSENFFHMCFGKVPNKEIVKAFDVSLILYAEHSFNVSTFTARTITSSLSDIHGAITGAIASLKGPLHGGANEEVMHMMKKIKKPENALKWITKALKNKDVVMGFGHRVYKSGDSRVPTMREYFKRVAIIKKDKTFEKIYDIVEKVMIKEKNIYPNVDYPTGPTYHLMGFDTDFFTPIFVISRITGWSAHIMEQHAANKLIRPLASYKGSKHRKVIQLNQR
ncbi:bifunctional 2-methylcitrate synthase/citrate synthase [Candidatus Pelagibacter sp. Uisw_101]|jgi:2-methylcitrate synthase|uniref:bifunctional 2-methylcitrate synthase/citrate synthase n=1 Tax=Candidatus Pelagibacter sp. Uisw_101 TaxID=3230982 RepID=UPI0039ECE92A